MPDSNYMDYIDYMRKMNIPMQYSPMMEMPQDQLESMYPRCYYIINPEVERQCDKMCAQYGVMHTPSRQQLDNMVDEIDNKVGEDVDADYQDTDENDERQFGGFGGGHFGGRRRFRRDLITILLLRALRRRRRPHFGGYPWGYGGGYGGYLY